MTSLAFQVPAQRHAHESWADLCRVCAIFGVVLIHSCGAAFYQYGKIPQADWLSANPPDSLARCSVPLFVMLSGALLLRSGEDRLTVPQIAIRIGKVLIPLLTWSVAYLWYVSGYNFGAIRWLSPLTQPAMYHLWFVYMIIGLYILLPIFQPVFRFIVNRRDMQIYLLCVWFIITCIPVYWPIPLLALMQQGSLLGYGGYFLIGGIIASAPPVRVPARIWWLLTARRLPQRFLDFAFLRAGSGPRRDGLYLFQPQCLSLVSCRFRYVYESERFRPRREASPLGGR